MALRRSRVRIPLGPLKKGLPEKAALFAYGILEAGYVVGVCFTCVWIQVALTYP